MEGYVEAHRGYQLRETLSEVYGEYELAWTLSGSNHELARSYSSFYESRRLPVPLHAPHLVRAVRERAAQTLATVTSQMFNFSPPCIGYSPKHQDLLELALEEKSDEDAATALGITKDAVARRWRSIHRLSQADPEVHVRFRAAEQGLKAPSTRKRHILLGILRQRKEELRPWHWPTARRYGWTKSLSKG